MRLSQGFSLHTRVHPLYPPLMHVRTWWGFPRCRLQALRVESPSLAIHLHLHISSGENFQHTTNLTQRLLGKNNNNKTTTYINNRKTTTKNK